MARDVFDRILTSTPLNATAGRVTARGVHWKPEAELPPGMLHWDAPPLLRPPTGISVTEGDLTGTKFGRFTVIGLLDGDGGKNRGNRWVCRCVCGDYEARSARSIKIASLSAPETLSNQCFYCVQWKATQNRYKKKGSKPLEAFINPSQRKLKNQTPEALIAEQIGDYEAAVKIVAKLNKSGFRIVRGEKSGILATPSPIGSEQP